MLRHAPSSPAAHRAWAMLWRGISRRPGARSRCSTFRKARDAQQRRRSARAPASSNATSAPRRGRYRHGGGGQRMGGLNVVVNCAGASAPRAFSAAMGRCRWSSSPGIQVNLIGTSSVTGWRPSSCSPRTSPAARERGVMIHTSSVAAFEGQIGQAAYSASKAGSRRHDPADRARAGRGPDPW